MLLCSSLELGKIFYALQVFGKFIKRACSEIKLEVTDRELCVVSAVGSDYAGGGSGPDLQGESIRFASAEERSCWRAGDRASLALGLGDGNEAMAAGGSVTPRRGLKVETMASVRSL